MINLNRSFDCANKQTVVSTTSRLVIGGEVAEMRLTDSDSAGGVLEVAVMKGGQECSIRLDYDGIAMLRLWLDVNYAGS
jgi:hypothetical protein